VLAYKAEMGDAVKVLITGGAGFIGSATSEILIGKGYEPIIVDNLYSGSLKNISHILDQGKAKFVKADVSKYDELKEGLNNYIKDLAAIIHLAALTNLEEVYRRPREAFKVNVLGTLNVLELARKYDINRVVFASSVAVYGEPMYLPIDEKHPTKPINLYGLTKLFSEELLWRYYNDYGLKPIALRYFNVYGPRMRPGTYAGVIYKFITSLLRGEPPIIYGDGKQTRDFIYVSDVAEANLRALESKYVGAVNIGSGKEISINELYKIIAKLLNSNIKPLRGPPRPGDVKRSRANISLALEKLSWSPKVSLEEGLKATINFYRSHIHKI
jgi:UDP-glucose 4-epimerase